MDIISQLLPPTPQRRKSAAFINKRTERNIKSFYRHCTSRYAYVLDSAHRHSARPRNLESSTVPRCMPRGSFSHPLVVNLPVHSRPSTDKYQQGVGPASTRGTLSDADPLFMISYTSTRFTESARLKKFGRKKLRFIVLRQLRNFTEETVPRVGSCTKSQRSLFSMSTTKYNDVGY